MRQLAQVKSKSAVPQAPFAFAFIYNNNSNTEKILWCVYFQLECNLTRVVFFVKFEKLLNSFKNVGSFTSCAKMRNM